jgi:hypothetical protein
VHLQRREHVVVRPLEVRDQTSAVFFILVHLLTGWYGTLTYLLYGNKNKANGRWNFFKSVWQLRIF